MTYFLAIAGFALLSSGGFAIEHFFTRDATPSLSNPIETGNIQTSTPTRGARVGQTGLREVLRRAPPPWLPTQSRNRSGRIVSTEPGRGRTGFGESIRSEAGIGTADKPIASQRIAASRDRHLGKNSRRHHATREHFISERISKYLNVKCGRFGRFQQRRCALLVDAAN
jgi:hypothetical protein